VRKVHAEALIKRLDDGELVLLSSLGYSPTGEVFNLTLEDVAVQAATAIRADKLIFLMDEPGIVDARGTTRRELTVSQADDLLAKQQVPGADGRLYLPFAMRASRGGVKRVHLVSEMHDGALLAELFTHDGVGTMVTEDPLERVRLAQIDDVGGVLRLIEPLEADGTLVKRSRELLEIEIGRFTVLEHDGVIVGCAALYPLAGADAGELACLAVAAEHRGGDAGERLLGAIEKQAEVAGIGELFVLTTRAAHWFLEQGFAEVDPAALPPSRQQMYNWQRRSKVLRKGLEVVAE
jgi:amino-acid N-acetyltransferase